MLSPDGWARPVTRARFSAKLMDGNHGVLNMTRACQGSFSGSRICTADEINRTVNVAEPPNLDHAWIQSGRASDQTATMSRTVARSVESQAAKAAGDDCAGWRSDSAKDSAMTIELASESGCYGGFVTRSCNERLPVACCACSDRPLMRSVENGRRSAPLAVLSTGLVPAAPAPVLSRFSADRRLEWMRGG